MRDLYKPTIRTCFMLLPLIVGVWVYSRGRAGKTLYEEWLHINKSAVTRLPLSNWLPDYLWCLSLLAGLAFLWKGWHKIPGAWKITIWVLVCSTELLQYLHLIPGTGDMMDFLFYQAAFVSVILLNKTNIL